MADTIKCPHCGKDVEISQALRHQVENQIKGSIEKDNLAKLEKAKELIKARLEKDLAENQAVEMADLKRQVESQKEKIGEFREQELKLREEKRRIEEEKEEIELKAKRQVEKERRAIEEKALKESAEKHRLREMEKEKIINDLKKDLEEAKRKADVNSQQRQGEVLELDIEETLRQHFPQDTVEPVGKGIKGADVRQTVKSPKGRVCGIILWESKRTKQWSEGWISKLKSDQRKEGAEIPAIVSSTLPKDTESTISLRNGVWVCTHSMIVPLSMLLRKSLLDAGYQKAVNEHRGQKADLIYDYITGNEFRQQVEALVEVFQEMQTQIERERAAFEKSWKQREGQLKRLCLSTAGIYGNVQGLAGSVIGQIKGLELLEAETKKS